MHKVFPAKLNTVNTEYEVEDKPYYTVGDQNYMKPTNANKSGNFNGWDGVNINGYAKDVSKEAPSSYYASGGGGFVKWLNDKPNDNPKIKEQYDKDFDEIGNNYNFKSLVKIW
jgi:hypothetical protein